MRPPLDGSILITGASAGIGEALARQMAGQARRLILVARREDRLRQLAEELRGQWPTLQVDVHPCDLGDATSRQHLLDALASGEPVDVLVNNAGFGDKSLLEHGQWERLERMLALNVVGLTHLTRALLPGMLAQSRGGILNLSSGLGLTWMPGVAVYAGTKHYVTAFSESLRAEVSGRGVVVTVVCPGPVRTEFPDNTHNTTGQKSPESTAISAEQCAAEALAAFSRGRALVVPGFRMRAMMRVSQALPRWLWRRMALRMVEPMREHARRVLSKLEPEQ